jgi:hypothetical protein
VRAGLGKEKKEKRGSATAKITGNKQNVEVDLVNKTKGRTTFGPAHSTSGTNTGIRVDMEI